MDQQEGFNDHEEQESSLREISWKSDARPIHRRSSFFDTKTFVALAGWRTWVGEAQRQKVMEIVMHVVEGLQQPELIYTHAQKAYTGYRWHPASLAAGLPGIVLPFLYLGRITKEERWLPIAQRLIQLAAQGTQQEPLSHSGLFGGTSGMASVLRLLCQDEARYQKTWQRLNRQLALHVLEQPWKRAQTHGVQDADYDVISGAAGILAYLTSISAPQTVVEGSILKLIAYLIWLSEMDEETGLRRWFIPPDLLPHSSYREKYPQGYFNCGLAHGIAGPLAALCLAWKAGYRMERMKEAIEIYTRWLLTHEVDDLWGPNWPDGVPLEFDKPELLTQLKPTRAAWCYGVPGIMCALQLACQVLDNEQWLDFKVEQIVNALLQRETAALRIFSPTFCHGQAGFLMIMLRLAQERPHRLWHTFIPELVEQLIQAYDASAPFGFRDTEVGQSPTDTPGLLTGAAGVALTLLAAVSNVEPDWQRLFLLM